MTAEQPMDRVEAVTTLLQQTSEAHDRYEKAELGGVYDQDWARWYAAYAVEHGIGDLIGHPVTADELGAFLARTNADREQAEPKPTESWAAFTTRRIVEEL